MKRIEVTIEVGPIDGATVERLKASGFAVFRGPHTWRVQAIAPVVSHGTVRAQAHAMAFAVVKEFSLALVTDPPAISLRDPDAGLDDRPDLLLLDAQLASDRPPTPRAKRKWYQHVMELGLGERKGD